MKIYFAAPIHDKEDREYNATKIARLRVAGAQVYSPQEHGLWEDLMELYNNDRNAVYKYLYTGDIQAMRACDAIVAMCRPGRGPSEGMVFEIGWGVAAHKNVYLLNEDNTWDYNLMLLVGVTKVFVTMEDLVNYIKQEDFR